MQITRMSTSVRRTGWRHWALPVAIALLGTGAVLALGAAVVSGIVWMDVRANDPLAIVTGSAAETVDWSGADDTVPWALLGALITASVAGLLLAVSPSLTAGRRRTVGAVLAATTLLVAWPATRLVRSLFATLHPPGDSPADLLPLVEQFTSALWLVGVGGATFALLVAVALPRLHRLDRRS